MDEFASLVDSTDSVRRLLTQLGEGTPTGARLAARFPELEALTVSPDDHVAWEHDRLDVFESMPLLNHAHRAVDAKLGGLEQRDRDRFQDDASLSESAFRRVAERLERLSHHGLDAVVRSALIFLDFTKGGTAEQREEWESAGADLTVHNLAAAHVLASSSTLRRFDTFTKTPVLGDLTRAVVAHHGLAGQWVRGETPMVAFREWVAWLRAEGARLGQALDLDESEAVEFAADCLHVVDVCDTAAVREGLVDDDLLAELESVRRRWLEAVGGGSLREQQSLEDRFARLRRQAVADGEPNARVVGAPNALSDAQREWVMQRLKYAQLWYFEPATHRLSSEAALKLLCLALAQADAAADVDVEQPFHLSLQPMVNATGAPDRASAYRVRLVEALLGEKSMSDVVAGRFPSNVLASFTPRIGGSAAVALELETTDEAEALVTLLTIYERRSSVAFHQILKLLCDAYGLRKDEFDRLANEAQYLATMNAARSDKERMLDFVRPGTIVEIGPGGGVVLDLLEERFDGSDVVGLDVSEAVVEELRRRRTHEGRQWRVVHGDAFELSETFGPHTVDTIVFCSVLHEIFSFVEWDDQRYGLGSVRAMLREAYRTLRPGGRLVIRDGVKPPPEGRVITFLDPDGPDFLRRFVDEFEARDIVVEWLDETSARMSAPDAMEFLYCYTWGPASFPYEVREQYGLMERGEYEAAVVRWLSDLDPAAVPVEVPGDLSSYLQPGYREGLADRVRLSDGAGRPVSLPDSNAVWVFEKPGAGS